MNRFRIQSELILVEWNPPNDRPPLKDALEFPENNTQCLVRIIQVPKEIHDTYKNSDKFPLFQMLGKNVGIQRAKGKFILATNIDILFSDSLMRYMKKKLRPGYSYRVDRLDVPRDLPKTSSTKVVLKFCRKNVLYAHTRFGSLSGKRKLTKMEPFRPKSKLQRIKQNYSKNPFRFVNNLIFKSFNRATYLLAIRSKYTFLLIPFYKQLLRYFSKNHFSLHTNACGDFTLMSRDSWKKLKGYPEWDVYSWNLDGILLNQAKKHGLEEIDLKHPIYHIDHGDGFLATDESQLFNRLEKNGISYVNNSSLAKIYEEIKTANGELVYNDDSWGLANHSLNEISFLKI